MVDEVNKGVRMFVSRGSEAAETVGESIRETVKDTLEGVRSSRDNVVMVALRRGRFRALSRRRLPAVLLLDEEP